MRKKDPKPMGHTMHVRDIDKKLPLFREFCRVHQLEEGDTYELADFINWADSLSLADQLLIAERYPAQVRGDEDDDRKSTGILEEWND